jgi:concanavalin A-like lectin/glucanase superfamily protein
VSAVPGGKSSASSSTDHSLALSSRVGSSGYALAFDGVDDYASAADSTTLRPETNNAFSVTFWVRLNSYNNNVLPRFWEKLSHYAAIMGDSRNGRYRNVALEVVNMSGSVVEFWGNTELDTRRWYHIAMTFDGSLPSPCDLYIDEKPETISTIGTWSGTLEATSTHDFFIARRRTDLNRNLDGEMDNFRFFQRKLTAEEVRIIRRYGSTPSGAKAVWDFDEGSGTSVVDGSGNGNRLTISGATWIRPNRGKGR